MKPRALIIGLAVLLVAGCAATLEPCEPGSPAFGALGVACHVEAARVARLRELLS